MNDAKYIKVSDVVDWFCPYGHMDESIPFETLVSDLRGAIHAADVAPVVHARWEHVVHAVVDTTGNCSACKNEAVWRTRNSPYEICPHCGARMDE